MSLINDVLRDLERRQPEAGGDGPSHLQPTPASPRMRRQWPLWLGAAAIIGAALHWTLSDYAPGPGDEAPLQAGLSTRATAEAAPQVAALESATPPVPVDDGVEDTPVVAESSGPAGPPANDAATGPVTADPVNAAEPEPAPPEPPAIAAVPSATESGPAAPPVNATATVAPTATAQSTIAIERADAAAQPDRDDDLEDARRALSRGQHGLAEQRLRALLERESDFDDARLLLANTLIRRDRHDDAMALLQRGLPQAADASTLAGLLGRLLLESGRTGRAIDILVAHAPALDADPEYHLVLAAAYRQANDHEAAAGHYRELARAVPGRATVWVGLGVSLEATQQAEQARDAYRRALKGNDLRAARFARQRLNALGPPAGDRP